MKNISYILIVFSMMFFSCSDNLEQEHEKVLPTNNAQQALLDAAIKFVNDVNGNRQTRSDGIVVKSVNKMTTRNRITRTDNEIRNIYSVVFDNNLGSAVVLGLNDTYIPIAYFQNEYELNINSCIADSLSEIGVLINHIVDVALYDDFDTKFTRSTGDNEIVERLAPKCKVSWHQYSPYNRYCFTKKGEQAVAGCVAIAGAQAMTVLRPQMEQITSWDEVVKPYPSSEAIDEIATLVHFIGEEVNMDYGVNESGAKRTDLVKLIKSYGIVDYDAARAIDVLKTEHGVIVIGGYRAVHGWGPWEHYVDGHAFIADGYIKYATGSDPYYMHLNYGWGADDNKNVYMLSSKKHWAEDAKDTYRKIFPHDLKYASLTYPSEKNW